MDAGTGEPISTPPLTGERTAPGIAHENYWFARHLAVYEHAARWCAGRRILDAGCGEGYGTELLAGVAGSVVGVELDERVVAHARRKYTRARFVIGNLIDIPAQDASVDVVVSLQVIEHLWDVDRFLSEVARVLVPGGLFLCATPNRLTFTPGSDTPVNPFHVREFTAAELAHELAPRFTVEQVLGVHNGRRLRAVERLLGRPLPERLLEQPPEAWPAWLRAVVRRVRPADFPITAEAIDASLDLLTHARAPA